MLKNKSYLQFSKLVLMVLLLSFFSFAHIWVRTKVVTSGYEVEKLRQDYGEKSEKNNRLSVEKDQVMSLKNLLKIQKLKAYSDLKPIREDQILEFRLGHDD